MINKLLNTFNSKKMTINNFEFVKNEDFEVNQVDTDLDCIGGFLYKTNNTLYWIEFKVDGFYVFDGYNRTKYYTLKDAYQALCIYVAENL